MHIADAPSRVFPKNSTPNVNEQSAPGGRPDLN